MRAAVGEKRGKWGLRLYFENREKWRTIGTGDEALGKARALADAVNAPTEAGALLMSSSLLHHVLAGQLRPTGPNE